MITKQPFDINSYNIWLEFEYQAVIEEEGYDVRSKYLYSGALLKDLISLVFISSDFELQLAAARLWCLNLPLSTAYLL